MAQEDDNNDAQPLQPPQASWAEVESELAMDASRRDALVRAVCSGDLATVQDMVAADNALAFHTLNRKTTLLVLSVEHNHLPVAAFLLERGVDPNKASQMRLGPLHAAARLPVRISFTVWPAVEFGIMWLQNRLNLSQRHIHKQDGRPLIRLLVRHKARLRPENQGGKGCYGWHSPLHEAAIRKRAANARLLAELGADPLGRDGHGMTPLDYCGTGSAVGRAIKEGLAVRGVRLAMRRLFFASVAEAPPATTPFGSGQGEGEDGDCDGDRIDGSKRRKRDGAPSWRDVRKQRGRPLPAIHFVHEAEEKGGAGVGGGKKAAALKEMGQLLQAVFAHVPPDVRRQIVLFV